MSRAITQEIDSTKKKYPSMISSPNKSNQAILPNTSYNLPSSVKS